MPWRDELVTAIPDVEAGELRIPGGPGWGVEVVEDVLHEHPWPQSKRTWASVEVNQVTTGVGSEAMPGGGLNQTGSDGLP